MVFSSLLFLFRFLPIALIAYYLVPHYMKNGVLFLVSMFFYAWGEPRYIIIMVISITVNYLVSNGFERLKKPIEKKLLLSLAIFVNLGFLMTFKYLDFFITNLNNVPSFDIALLGLTLPLGISFYTFQTMSYTLDVYWEKVEAEKNIIDFAAYVSLFPQLIAGPIVKYVDIKKDLKEKNINLKQINTGIRYFIMGLASKVLIANNIGLLWDDIQLMGVDNISTVMAWLGILAFAFQIYFDFSGYSLMAIGLGKMLGFEFPTNFDFPYMSRSITEFWRRWHITLGNWFREYVYIPLGGNRKGFFRQIINLFIVWFLTGFWHGASWNFILWGLYFAFFLVMEKLFFLEYLEKHKYLSHFYAIILVLFGWVIFATSDFIQMKDYFLKMFSLDLGNDYLYILQNYGLTFLLAGIFSTPWIKNVFKKYQHHKFLVALGLLFLFLISMGYLVDSSFNPFLYFRF